MDPNLKRHSAPIAMLRRLLSLLLVARSIAAFLPPPPGGVSLVQLREGQPLRGGRGAAASSNGPPKAQAR
jgi:hypothetical protein